jgi:hypothetical protein
VSINRILFIIAAVLFLLAWLVSLGTLDASGDFFTFQALVALGLTSTAAGLAA